MLNHIKDRILSASEITQTHWERPIVASFSYQKLLDWSHENSEIGIIYVESASQIFLQNNYSMVSF